MDSYRLDKATRPLTDLLDDASNWYVRRSRRRFWKSEDDNDKAQAYATLHYTLLRLCQLLAPFSPFLSDHIWRQLVAGTDLPESVHLSDWPQAEVTDSELLTTMAKARDYITVGLSQRAEAKVKVRQPLNTCAVPELPDEYRDIVAEELNVKEVVWGDDVRLDATLTPELKREGLMRDVVRLVQNARKQAGLEVDDRIVLQLETADEELKQAIAEHQATICQETLATDFGTAVEDGFVTAAKVEGMALTIRLKKSA